MTTVFSAYVTARGQAWVVGAGSAPAPGRRDPGRSGVRHETAAGDEATGPAGRGRAAREVGGVRRGTAATRSSARRPRRPGWRMWRSSRATTRSPCRPARRSALIRPSKRRCSSSGPGGNGSQGPRYSDWAMTATAVPGQYLLIRRLISRPDQLTFCLCGAPPGRPATMTYFVTIAGRKWPVEETFKTGKDVLGLGPVPGLRLGRDLPPHRPGRPRPAPGSHYRGALTGRIALPAASSGTGHDSGAAGGDDHEPVRSPADPTGRTPPSRPAAGSPARPASPRSGRRSPRPPGPPAWPRTTPPG